jgi:hypothetical protein
MPDAPLLEVKARSNGINVGRLKLAVYVLTAFGTSMITDFSAETAHLA